jgi:hypothetical protein
MLDEGEFAVVVELWKATIKGSKELRQKCGLPFDGLPIEDRFRPVLDAYERFTGFRETNANAVMHHRLSLDGPPCNACGKPLRTPHAKYYVKCDAPRPAEAGNASEPKS